MQIPVGSARAAHQDDTLVLSDHRGHRLGLLVKAANLVALADHAPLVPAVYTWNAEENRPMLAVNERLGFVAVGAHGTWQRVGPSGR